MDYIGWRGGGQWWFKNFLFFGKIFGLLVEK